MKLEKVFEIIDWWGELPIDFVDSTELFYQRRKLAAYYVQMGRFLSNQSFKFNNLHAKRRVGEAKKLILYTGDIDPTTEKYNTLGKSEAKAIVDIEEDYTELYRLKGICEGMDINMKTVWAVLNAMKQELWSLAKIKEDEQMTEADNFPKEQR